VPDRDAVGDDGREQRGMTLAGRELDVVDLLLVQHARIEELFTLAAGTRGGRQAGGV
jgi:hypothetical protein